MNSTRHTFTFQESLNEPKEFTPYFLKLAESDSRIVTILTTHLLIENVLLGLIEVELKKPGVLQHSRLTFNQIVLIAEGLHGNNVEDFAWSSIRMLNKIRNSFAHQVKPKELDQSILDFIKQILDSCPEGIRGPIDVQSPKSQLQLVSGLLYSYMAAYLEVCKNSEALEREGKKPDLESS